MTEKPNITGSAPAPVWVFVPHDPADPRDYVAELWALALDMARATLADRGRDQATRDVVRRDAHGQAQRQ